GCSCASIPTLLGDNGAGWPIKHYGATNTLLASDIPIPSTDTLELLRTTIALRFSLLKAKKLLNPPVPPLCQKISSPFTSRTCQARPSFTSFFLSVNCTDVARSVASVIRWSVLC